MPPLSWAPEVVPPEQHVIPQRRIILVDREAHASERYAHNFVSGGSLFAPALLTMKTRSV